jgi:hypothetical protein
MKHTELPWTICTRTQASEVATIHGVERVPTEDGLGQEWVYIKGADNSFADKSTQTANAAFICHAVNNHYKLVGALSALFHSNAPEAIEKARAALASATEGGL